MNFGRALPGEEIHPVSGTMPRLDEQQVGEFASKRETNSVSSLRRDEADRATHCWRARLASRRSPTSFMRVLTSPAS